jgi:PAS domain S-box-containing protein
MIDGSSAELAKRVLVLAPTARDAVACRDLFAAERIGSFICNTIADVCREAERGAGAAVVTAEAILGDRDKQLAAWLETQEPWSDFPLIVLTPPGPESPKLLQHLEAVGHMTFMKRPVQILMLVSIVRAMLRDRQRQYAVCDLLAESRRAAEVLREQRERYRVTLASIGDAVIATDIEGRVTFLNQVGQQLTGWVADTALGRPIDQIFRIVHETTRQPLVSPVQRVLSEGATVGLVNHTILVGRDGSEYAIDDSAAPMRNESGDPVGAVLVFRDITDKARAERDRALLASVVESSEDAIISKTLEGIILSWNTGAEQLFGYTPQEAIGRPITLIIPLELKQEESAILGRIRDGKRVEHFETVRVSKQGRRIDISLTISPVRDGEGRVIGASKVARDITDRKRAEAALKEANRRKDEFIALLAHELRNPLAPLRNGLHVMRLAGDDAEAVAQARTMMDRQLGHLVRLVDDLLDVARITQNKMELRRSRVLLADAVDNAVEAARPFIEAAGLELTVLLPAEPVFLDADLTRLSQVISNLLTNSAKYTDRGGRIWLSAEIQPGTVRVSVRDNGIGIPAESLSCIFDMFSQVDRSVERTTGGLGIGLALVKGLVEMHGGTVKAQSGGPGAGSTFTVSLPVLETSPALPEVATPDESRTLSGPKRKILVVDDNRDSADSMALMLKLAGHEIVTAHDGIEAVEVAQEFRPEVVLMDIGMPRLNGLDATRRIRAETWGKTMIIIALTGWGQDTDRDQSKEAGCDGHLVKPITLSDLANLFLENRHLTTARE